MIENFEEQLRAGHFSKQDADQLRHSLRVQLSLTPATRELIALEAAWFLNNVQRLIVTS